MADPLLSLNALHVRRGPRQVIAGVDLSVRAG